MANFCPNCGAKIREGVKFCGSCGEKISDASSPKSDASSPKSDASSPKIELQKSSPAQINDSQPTYTPPESTPVESTSLSAVKNHMRKIFALIGILVIVGVAAYFASNQSDEALDEFYLGMSKDEADRKFGAGTLVKGSYYYESEKFRVKFDSNNKAEFISCLNETLNTKKGIHIGSTLDEVKRAYGNDYLSLSNGFAHIYTFGDSLLTFFINTKTNRVVEIALERYSRR